MARRKLSISDNGMGWGLTLEGGSLQSHKLKCIKHKTGAFTAVKAQVGGAGVSGEHLSPSKGDSHHSVAANCRPGRMA